jgi:hypothetical protein
MMETSTGYDESSLNGVSREANARAGQRLRPLDGEPPYGAGDTPRFTVRANPSAGEPPPDVLKDLVDPAIRPNLVAGGIELVRPDGYVAMSVADGEWNPVAIYLDRLRVVATSEHKGAGAGRSS